MIDGFIVTAELPYIINCLTNILKHQDMDPMMKICSMIAVIGFFAINCLEMRDCGFVVKGRDGTVVARERKMKRPDCVSGARHGFYYQCTGDCVDR